MSKNSKKKNGRVFTGEVYVVGEKETITKLEDDYKVNGYDCYTIFDNETIQGKEYSIECIPSDDRASDAEYIKGFLNEGRIISKYGLITTITFEYNGIVWRGMYIAGNTLSERSYVSREDSAAAFSDELDAIGKAMDAIAYNEVA